MTQQMTNNNLSLSPSENFMFSIVSAVYGVEAYIDEFLKSVLEQRNFDVSQIQIILVDDGSRDGSAKKIRTWQAKYPRNIFYIKQKNQGQSVARNRGLRLVKGEWIAFIDPDDTINDTFFESVMVALSKDKLSYSIIHANVILCEDGTNRKQRHPLAHRFDNGTRHLSVKDINYMPSSATVSMFRRDLLTNSNIKYNKRIRPNFEDGDFTIRYLMHVGDGYAIYISDAKYYYRKRLASTLSSVWNKTEKFKELFESGYLPLLEDCQNGPRHISKLAQKQVMYDLSWYIRAYWRKAKPAVFAQRDVEVHFWALFLKCIAKIDDDVIHDVKSHILSGEHKAWLLGVKHGKSYKHAVLDRFDRYTGQARIRSICFNYSPLVIKADRQIVHPTHEKIASFEVFGKKFQEHVVWVSTKGKSFLRIEIDDMPAKVWVSGRGYHDIPTKEAVWQGTAAPAKKLPNIIKWSITIARMRLVKKLYAGAWLVMDRDGQADDNAEHLYRYLKTTRPDIKSYFVLKKNANDYSRLKSEGFKMVPHGSLRHLLLKLNARFLISSHVDQYVLGPFPDKFYARETEHKVIFLQHGVIRDDISTWLNTKSIDLFVTTSPEETSSIVGSGTGYHYTSREVQMVGLARHDRLIKMADAKERTILIMPTWREWLVGGYDNAKSGRRTNENFYSSKYAQTWKSLLHSQAFKSICERSGYKVVFFPHKNMQIYTEWFSAPDWIETRTHATDPILQKLYARSAVMITDYSSVFFEFGILERPVIHYQFDFDEMYGGKHPSRLGYLDFKSDGFGPVVENESSLLRQLEILLQNECAVDPIYLQRMRSTLPLRDGLNCARTVAAIEERYPHQPEIISEPKRKISNKIFTISNSANNFRQKTVKRHSIRVAILTPFVKALGNKNDVKKLHDNPRLFFSRLRNPIYRSIGKIFFLREKR
ncbi:CDP-glycerol glycerophosphotransferase family protein [Agrobacterium sp. BA1120]|uniref:bifunctional glycosyltransferase/CDP-glycerol:glycerophosphate glycerophosphotransferase n=1 Tax=Agrobacterium sp. BA1120 TaxID=3228927 RepID=UPI003369BFF0